MLGHMTMMSILIFVEMRPGREVGQRCFLSLVMVIYFWTIYFRDGISFMLRYVYGLFCNRIGRC